MKIKRAGAILLAVAMLLSGCAVFVGENGKPGSEAPGSTSSESEGSHSFGVGYSGDYYDETVKLWQEKLDVSEGTSIKLEAFGENVLGTSDEMVKYVQKGTLSIIGVGTYYCSQIVPEIAMMDIPTCYSESIRPYFIFKGEFFNLMNQRFQSHGLELLSLRTSEQCIISSKKPIKSLDQLIGKKVSVSDNRVHQYLYSRLGLDCLRDIMPEKLGDAIDNNGIDAVEATYTMLKKLDILEKQPYGLKDGIFLTSNAFVMNRDAFMSLSDKEQALLKETLAEVLESNSPDGDKEARIMSGMTVSGLSEQDKTKITKLARPIIDGLLKTVDQELFDAFINEFDKVSSMELPAELTSAEQ